MEPFPGPLVGVAWLRAHLDDVVLVDVRWVPAGSADDAFDGGHIPGALSFDLDRDLAAPAFDGPGRHPLPTPEAFAETMSRVGIGDATPVVAYDDARGSVAARLWWMLDVLGHPAAVLDGGIEAWDGPLETVPGRTTTRTVFTPEPWPPDAIADADAVERARLDPAQVVIDLRAAERYRGEVEPYDPVAGHIPGARSAPWTDGVDPGTGRFLDPAPTRVRWAGLGVSDASRVIAQCGSGVTACHGILSLRIAGLGRARLYQGSWSDWVSDPGRPIAVGD
jgi:thiosulfate/3-mercaptopyruvate sulfurtransferase